jgi:hypothetical protein
VVLRDRWRLAEGHLTVILPALDCYPAPAAQRTLVVLSRTGRLRIAAFLAAGEPLARHRSPAQGAAAQG